MLLGDTHINTTAAVTRSQVERKDRGQRVQMFVLVTTLSAHESRLSRIFLDMCFNIVNAFCKKEESHHNIPFSFCYLHP